MIRSGKIVILLTIVLAVSCKEESKEGSAFIHVQPLSAAEEHEFLGKGKEITKIAFSTLSEKLKNQMALGGFEGAVSFCNVHALPITDSLQSAFHVSIKRTSDKIRNPKNQPTELETKQISFYQEKIKKEEDLSPRLELIGNKVAFYAPIILEKPLCLACHGTPGSSISDTNYSFIKQYYPEDKAINYSLGDLRGIWSLEFERK